MWPDLCARSLNGCVVLELSLVWIWVNEMEALLGASRRRLQSHSRLAYQPKFSLLQQVGGGVIGRFVIYSCLARIFSHQYNLL